MCVGCVRRVSLNPGNGSGREQGSQSMTVITQFFRLSVSM